MSDSPTATTIARLERAQLEAARAVLASAWPEAATVAEEKLFAPGAAGPAEAWVATVADDVVGVMVCSGDWLRVLAVTPRARGRGIGSSLLARATGRLRLMAQPGNYLSPGLPAEDTAARAWLEKRGFVVTGENTNLIVDVATNPKVSAKRARELAERATRAGYSIGRARASDDDVRALVATFGSSWSIEVERALEAAPGAVHVARDVNGAPVAFAAHDGNNRGLGWFGPAGTLEAHRGRGLGAALLLPCLLDIAAAGHATATIAWIGPRGFYDAVCGIAGDRRYLVMERR